MATPKDVLGLMKESGAEIVDFRFCDLLGTWQHTSKSISDVDEEIFESYAPATELPDEPRKGVKGRVVDGDLL